MTREPALVPASHMCEPRLKPSLGMGSFTELCKPGEGAVDMGFAAAKEQGKQRHQRQQAAE